VVNTHLGVGEMEGTKYSHWFLIVVAVFVTCLITANIIAVKLVDL